jgi:PadR family transcriptional regulator, regulatory protein PadR
MPRTTNPNFMAGVPELMILRLLQGGSDMYGYQIVQAIRDVVSLGEGVVYTVLHALEREKALKSRRKMVDGRSRTYYTVTAKGLKRYTELANNWSTLAAAIQSVLEGKRHAPV